MIKLGVLGSTRGTDLEAVNQGEGEAPRRA